MGSFKTFLIHLFLTLVWATAIVLAKSEEIKKAGGEGEGKKAGGEHAEGGESEEEAKKEEALISTGFIVILVMLMFYMSTGAAIEKYHVTFGHEASFTVLMGMLISFVEYMQNNKNLVQMMKFDDNTFFFFCLPPIVFASGFNMQRGDFFGNIGNILLFGVLGTFISFGSFTMMTLGVNKAFQGVAMEEDGITEKVCSAELLAKDPHACKVGLTRYHYDGDVGYTPKYLDLKLQDIMLFCSLMCSSDVVAAISLVSYEKDPMLYSVVFGEGITNDAVSIILFNTVLKFTASGKNAQKIDGYAPLKILKDFTVLAFNSLMIGIIFALLSAFILKKFRVFSRNPVMETMMIFCFGYLAYVVSEISANSGIITLLTVGVVMAHYTWYNLSPMGKQASYTVFQFLGYIMEAFVFSYLGLTFFSYAQFSFSIDLFIIEIFVIMIGRLGGTLGLITLLKICRYNAGLSVREIIFIWYAGMIRGAIAFGLVLRIHEGADATREVVVTTALALVIFTTVLFGSTVAILQKCLFGDKEKEAAEKLEGTEETGEAELTAAINADGEKTKDHENNSALASQDSSYEDFYHPNEGAQRDKKHHHVYTGCAKYLHRFDELVMRPMLIYKYEKNMAKKSKEFFNLFMQHGDEIQNDWNKEEFGRRSSIRNQKGGGDDPSASNMFRAKDLQEQDEHSGSDAGSVGRVMRKIAKQKTKHIGDNDN